MSVAGPCELCVRSGTSTAEAGTITDGCDRCGRLVCADHYEEPLCTECAATLGTDPTGNAGPGRGSSREHPDVNEHRF